MAKTQSSTDSFLMALRTIEEDPMWGVRNILRVDADQWQEELIEAVWDVKRKKRGLPTKFNHEGLNKISVRAMHGPGKTFGVALLSHLWFMTHPTMGFATAPKEKQLKSRLWPAIRKIRSMAIKEYQRLVKVDSLRVIYCGNPDWGLWGETASDPDNLAGYHDDYILVICEEAAGIDEKFFPVIEGAISTGICPILILIGNPTNNQGTFYDSHNRRGVMETFYKLHVSLDKTTRVSKDWVDSMRVKYGDDSPIFKIRCLGEFADSAQGQIIPLQTLLNSVGNIPPDDGSIPKLRVSVDVSDGGEDESVVTVQRIYDSFRVFVRQESFSFPPSESIILTADAAERMFLAYGGNKDMDEFVVDGLGVGAGTAGTLLRRGYRVIVFKGGEASDIPDRWKNKRTQAYIAMRDEFFAGTLYIEDDFTDRWDDFEAQMCSIKYKEGGDRLDELMTKKDMKAKGIKSPDMADSSMMGFATDIPDQLLGAMSSLSELQGDTLASAGGGMI